MSTGLTNERISDAQLAKYARLIYDRTGIAISPKKQTLLSNRLRRRLRETGIKDYAAYYNHVSKLAQDDAEWDAFLQEITTHETYLFRDEGQWNWFRDCFLPDIASSARSGDRKRELRIWSAACSTGDEAFTIAACIAAKIPNVKQWKIEILGTDIGIGALEEAKAAKFGERAMRLVPDDYRRRFFRQVADNCWEAKPDLVAMTTFRPHNLMEPFTARGFDLIFLKNVLIYFDAGSKTTVMANLRAVMQPGGLLLTGAAEGVSNHVGDLERIQPWLHRCPC